MVVCLSMRKRRRLAWFVCVFECLECVSIVLCKATDSHSSLHGESVNAAQVQIVELTSVFRGWWFGGRVICVCVGC